MELLLLGYLGDSLSEPDDLLTTTTKSLNPGTFVSSDAQILH